VRTWLDEALRIVNGADAEAFRRLVRAFARLAAPHPSRRQVRVELVPDPRAGWHPGLVCGPRNATCWYSHPDSNFSRFTGAFFVCPRNWACDTPGMLPGCSSGVQYLRGRITFEEMNGAWPGKIWSR